MRSVLELPATERFAWERHFTEYPIGDYHTHRLLAQLCLMIAQVFSDKNKHLTLYDFAPWLETPGVKEQVAKSKLDSRRRKALEIARSASHAG